MTPRALFSLALAAAGLLPEAAFAHCPVSYSVTGPGGAVWLINLAGNHYEGVLPGGTTAQFGPITTWSDTRRIGQTTGLAAIDLTVTDGTDFALCPTVTMNLSGPPGCDEDFPPPSYAPHPLCIPHFTVVRTAPGVFSCSSTCQTGTFPAPQAYTPPASAPPALTALVPSSAKAAGAAVALSVAGSGFVPGAVVDWNGTPLSTEFVNGGLIVALVPGSLLVTPGTADVKAEIPGGVSASLAFTVSP